MGVLDYVWLGYIAKKLYRNEIGSLLLDKPNMVAAVIFYTIYVFGIVIFVTQPALANNSLPYACVYGLAFGFIAYATYDFTNLAVVKGFTTRIAIIDVIWGALLTMTTSCITYLLVSVWT